MFLLFLQKRKNRNRLHVTTEQLIGRSRHGNHGKHGNPCNHDKPNPDLKLAHFR